MTIAVLVKVVPDLDKMAFDPSTKTARRSGARLFANPFDQRAVLAALTLREREGEEVVVISMGPPDTHPAIREMLALGANRALVVSDPALVGSDTSVTAHVLAAAVRRLSPRLVLTGRWTTDSSTGQLPAQVAQLLDLPMVDAARKITLSPDGTVVVIGETDCGYAEHVVPQPCLVSVGEKIIRSRRPTPEELQEAESKALQVLGPGDLDLPLQSVGLAGSLTQVLELENEEPGRTPKVFAEGAPEHRAREATGAIVDLLARVPVAPLPLRDLQAPGPEEGEVLVLASTEDGDLEREALPLLSEVRRLPGPLWPSAVGIGPLTGATRQALATAGALRAYWREDRPNGIDAEGASEIVAALLRSRPKAACALFLSSTWSREVAGRVSARSGLGLTGDAIGLRWDEERGPIFRKPSFGGGLIANVASRARPSLATVRPGSLVPGSIPASPGPLELLPLPGTPRAARVRKGRSVREVDDRFPSLDHAHVVVCVGSGVGGSENLPTVLQTVRPLHAALGATRRVVDAGVVPVQLQVGLTGRSLSPDLYVGVGLSGKINHLIGVKRARVLVGINENATEPLFQHVDVGLVGSWQELLPPLVEELARRLPREILTSAP